MDRKEFFIKLHQDLGIKYGLEPSDVNAIRGHYVWWRKMDRKHIAQWCITKLKRKTFPPMGPKRKERNQRIVAFVAKCTDEQWADITQKTEYDK